MSNKKKRNQEMSNRGSRDINAIRQAVVSREFERKIGRRTIIMIAQYPFLIIGEIENVVSDYVFVKAEFTNVSELDGHLFRVHTDDIEVFFIETLQHPIPKINVFGEEH